MGSSADATRLVDRTDGAGLTPSQRPPTLREHALQSIRRAILTGALRPGSRIVEDEVAALLGISRGPVREAIRALEQEGLVRSEPHRASYVAVFSEEEMDGLYAVRAAVEAMAARTVAALVAAEGERIDGYRALLDRMRQAAAGGDLEGLAAADLDFHQRLLDDTGFTLLPRVWQAMDGVMRARTYRILASEPRGAPIVTYTAESHQPIVDALAAGDPARAAEAVRHHILETRDLWARTVAARPEQAGG